MSTLIQKPLANGITQLTLNNTRKANALDNELCQALTKAINQLSEDDCTKVIILSANGKAFCAGGDIKAMAEGRDMFAGTPEEISAQYQQIIHPVQLAIHHSRIPIIAAVDGAATGAGNDLVAHCDIVVATPRAKFCESFIRLGLISGDGGFWILPKRIGEANARWMALTGNWVTAERAQQMGLVNDIVQSEQLDQHCVELAEQIAKHPLEAIRATRQCFQHAQSHTLEQHLSFCAEQQGKLHYSEAHKSKLNDLLNKAP